MHVLHCCFDKKYVGTDQAFLQYTRALVQLGHQVTAIIHPKFRFISELEDLNVSYFQLGVLFKRDPIAVYRLKSIIKHVQPDSCITHDQLTLRTMSLVKPSFPLVAVVYKELSGQYSQVEKFILSDPELRSSLEEHGIPESKVMTIPSPILYPPHFTFSWSEAPVIGFFVNSFSEKPALYFLEVLHSLKKKGHNYRLCIGSVNTVSKAVKDKVKQYKLEDTVMYKEKLLSRDALYEEVDVFYYIDIKGMANTLSEAMANGKVVVTASNPNVKKYINHGNNGILYSEKDSNSLAYQLETLLSSEKNANFLAENAYNTATELYSLDKLRMTLSEFIESPEYAHAA